MKTKEKTKKKKQSDSTHSNGAPAPTTTTPQASGAATPAPPTIEPPKQPPKKEEQPKAPSISQVTRKLVIQNPTKTVDEISQLLIDGGWDAGDVEKRKSTIATLRADALAILKIAKECGWEKK